MEVITICAASISGGMEIYMKIDRLIAIIMVLLEREKVNADELAKMFEVSKRTIYRDIDSINLAGIPVAAVSGPGNGICILKSYKVEKHLFSTTDITTLLMALGSIQSNLPSQEITNALAKIKGMVPLEKQEELNFRTNQVKIDLSPWFSAGSSLDKINTIKKAMEQQFCLKFEYRDSKNNKSVREIEPYCLRLKSEDWYIQGYCLLRHEFRTFKVLRMQNICITEDYFECRKFSAEEMELAHFDDKNLSSVTLRIHERIRDKIVSRFGEECLTPDGLNYYIAQVLMPIDELASCYLMGFGDQCECLEPEEMRQIMYQVSKRINSMYA